MGISFVIKHRYLKSCGESGVVDLIVHGSGNDVLLR
jgi:hypothetical protein